MGSPGMGSPGLARPGVSGPAPGGECRGGGYWPTSAKTRPASWNRVAAQMRTIPPTSARVRSREKTLVSVSITSFPHVCAPRSTFAARRRFRRHLVSTGRLTRLRRVGPAHGHLGMYCGASALLRGPAACRLCAGGPIRPKFSAAFQPACTAFFIARSHGKDFKGAYPMQMRGTFQGWL